MTKITYSEIYETEDYEYRHVTIPKAIAQDLPNRRLTVHEWQSLNVDIDDLWENYMIHMPERHILLFRKKKVNKTN